MEPGKHQAVSVVRRGHRQTAFRVRRVVVNSAVVSPLVPSLAAQIVEIIRRENLAVGQRITEQSLCDALGVSRSPVRKALQFLAGSGIVRSEPNKGFQVAKPARSLVHRQSVGAEVATVASSSAVAPHPDPHPGPLPQAGEGDGHRLYKM